MDGKSFNPTAEWCQMHNRYYTKRNVYTMSWSHDTDLSQLVVACGRFGGPVALVRDDRQVLLLNTADVRPTIRIHSCSGHLLSQIPWDHSRLVAMGWTDEEKLACVVEDGSVVVYSVHGELDAQFSMGPECNDVGVVDAVVWGAGVVVLTSRNNLYAAAFDGQPRPRRLAETGLGMDDPPTCIAVREPRHTLSGCVEVLLGTSSGSILVVDEAACDDQGLTNGPFARLALSADGNYLAAFTETGAVWVTHADFSKSISEFGTNIKVPPKQLEWCGSDSVVMHWDELLLMVGPFGDWIKYAYEEPLVLVPEVDGCRVLTPTKCEFLQMVPESTLSIFKIGSTDPPAMLYDAFEQFERRSAKADENVREVRTRGQLPAAIDGCVDAATHEFEYEQQRSLLRAAAFGKCFAEMYPAERFVDACRTLRVLNAVRHHEVGIPLTVDQLRALTVEVLISRLINAHHHLLASRICEFLSLPQDAVLVHWACAKVRPPPMSRPALPDAQLAEVIVGKLRGCPGISYAEVASTAFAAGRAELATMLLDHEPRAAKQVPLLISMKQGERALIKAVQSGDTDLVHMVLLHLKQEMPADQFFELVADKPAARDLLVRYCRAQDFDTLKTFYYHLDQRDKAANLCVIEAYAKTSLRARVDALKIAEQFYQAANPFATRATEDQARLLLIQADLEAEFNNRARSGETLFIDKPLSETIFNLIVLGNNRTAERLRDQFKVPDRRFHWIKARALVQLGAWDALEKFAGSRKSPIGYQPFVELCVEAGNPSEAAKYIAHLPQLVDRVHWYVQIKYLREAADIAVRLKDPDLINMIRAKMNDREQEFLNNLLRSQDK